MLSDAELIRDYPEGDERMAEAARQIRAAMLEHTLGRISFEEQKQIIDILAFALPKPDPPKKSRSLPPDGESPDETVESHFP